METDAEIAARIQDVAASSPGIEELSVDGIRIRRDKAALDFFERRSARKSIPVTRPIAASIDLS